MRVPLSHSLRLASHFTKPNWANPKNTFHLFKLFSFSTTVSSEQNRSSHPTPPSPPPIRVALTHQAGRGVFATRPIAAGVLIHTAEPALCHSSLSSIHTVCYSCLRKLPHSTDSQPQTVSFCNEYCKQRCKEYYDVEMKVNWMAFDDYCRTRGLKYPLMVKRMACMVISGVARSDTLDILQPAHLTPDMILERFGTNSNQCFSH